MSRLEWPLLAHVALLFAFSGCTPPEDTSEKDLVMGLALIAATAADPTVRITNNSGGTETYTWWTGAGCTGTAAGTYAENPVANLGSTSAITLPYGTYYLSYDTPATSNCLSGGITFGKNRNYTCTSTSMVTCRY